MKYIYQIPAWPEFTWDKTNITLLLGEVRNLQGRLLGRMQVLGLALRQEANLKTLTSDVVKTSEIEGEFLDPDKVRSSIARKLGMDLAGLVPSDRHVDGVVEMMLDATQNFDKPLTKARLFAWHASLFPSGYSGMHKIRAGTWRDDSGGPMRVVSGSIGREKIHFEAPPADILNTAMSNFIKWFNRDDIEPVLKSAIAHLWFVTLHPFDDGNGRVARAISDMQLARADCSKERFYSMSVQIRKDRNKYYEILEKTQKITTATKEGIDISAWLEWFLLCLKRSLDTTDETLEVVFKKARFWESHPASTFNDRQKKIINQLFEGFEGKLTSSKWAAISKCSHDTALRDILDLINKDILLKDSSGGRSTSYLLNLK